MTTPTPAELDIEISRSSGFQQGLQIRCQGGTSAVDLRGYRFYAQLWNADGTVRYLSLEVPFVVIEDGLLQLLLRDAVTSGLLTGDDVLSGGAAGFDDPAPLLSGGTAPSTGVPISGGRAFSLVMPSVTRWDLLMVQPSGRLQTLLRGIATLVA